MRADSQSCYQGRSSGGWLNAAHDGDFSEYAYQGHATAQTIGLGKTAGTTFGKFFFDRTNPSVTVNGRFQSLSLEQAQMITALHELGHMTGATAVIHPTTSSGSDAVDAQIYEKCIK